MIPGSPRHPFPMIRASFGPFLCSAVLLLANVGCSRTSTQAPTPSPAATPAAPQVKTYTTNFPQKEDPISEGGRWTGGKTVGIDWGNVSTTPGYAIGTAGPKRFADSVALLTGTWGPNQTAEAVVKKVSVHGWPEVSLRLRSSLSLHDCSGYEISNSLRSDDTAYLIIVRWNGPLADFSYLVQAKGKQYGVTTGDVVKATIVGNVITAYKNGVQLAQVRDNTYLNGQPGFGFNEGRNGDYGMTRVTITAADAPANDAAGSTGGGQ
jgi:hypothetical protein